MPQGSDSGEVNRSYISRSWKVLGLWLLLGLVLTAGVVLGIEWCYERTHQIERVQTELKLGLLAIVAVVVALLLWRESRGNFRAKLRETKLEEERFRDAIRGAPIPAVILAEDGEIIEINRAWTDCSGHLVSDFKMIDDWIERVFSHEAAAVRIQFKEVFKTDSEEVKFECRPEAENGESRIWTCGSAITGRLPDGRRVATTFATDVTEQLKAAAESRDTSELINSMFMHAATGLISYRPDGQTVVANPAAAKITGGTVEQLQASNFNTINSWKASGLLSAARRALAENVAVKIDAEFETTYGNRVALVGSFVPFMQSGDRWLLFAFHNELEARETKAELRKLLEDQRKLNSKIQTEIAFHKQTISKHRLLQSALESVPSGIVITDPLGNIEWANPGYTRLTGYDLTDAIGRSTNLLKSGRQDDAFYRNLWETISNGESWSGDLENRRKDGSIYWEAMVISPILSESRSITHYVAIKRDITERRLLEDQISRSQRMESIGMLAGGLSHDLNNVLSPIMMGLELFRTRSKDPKEIARLDMLMNSAERGAGIVRQMLTFARGVDGERAPLNPLNVLKEVSSFLQETMPPAIKIKLDMPEQIDRVMADVTQLHQVLINLGINARDAMPSGGELTLRVRKTEVAQDVVTRSGLTLKVGNYIQFEIGDTGSGIPAEMLDQIFDPFFTTKLRGRGTGLGLSSAHGIVRGHGGAIDVETEMGEGTRFMIYLPVCDADTSRAPFEELSDIIDGDGRVILVVDDEVPVLTLVEMALEERDFKVDQATDGQMAIDLFEKQPDRYSAVILDFLMPEMDGSQVAIRIKELKPDIPLILSSGVLSNGGENDEKRDVYRDLGDFEMKKPFSMSRLLSVLRSALEG